MKGVNVGRREVDPTPAAPQPNLQPVVNTAPPADPRNEAAAVLFNGAQAPYGTQAGYGGSPYATPTYATPSYAQPTPEATPTPSYGAGYGGLGGAFAGPTIGNRHILVSQPRTDAEVTAVVEHLRTNEAVIVNFEGIPTAETQRRIDFLSGVACGLGGTIKPLDAYKYILTPSGIGIR